MQTLDLGKLFDLLETLGEWQNPCTGAGDPLAWEQGDPLLRCYTRPVLFLLLLFFLNTHAPVGNDYHLRAAETPQRRHRSACLHLAPGHFLHGKKSFTRNLTDAGRGGLFSCLS